MICDRVDVEPRETGQQDHARPESGAGSTSIALRIRWCSPCALPSDRELAFSVREIFSS